MRLFKPSAQVRFEKAAQAIANGEVGSNKLVGANECKGDIESARRLLNEQLASRVISADALGKQGEDAMKNEIANAILN